MLLAYLQRPRLIFKAVGLAGLPLLSYAYIYIRGAQHPEWRGAGQWPSAWAWFIDFLTIRQGRDELAPGLAFDLFATEEFPALIWQELTWPIFLGGLLGLVCLGGRRAIFLYVTLAIYLLFSWGYRFGNWFQVIIPAYPIFIIGFAAGIEALKRRFESTNRTQQKQMWERYQRFSSILIVLLLVSLLIYRLITNYPLANQRDLALDTGLDPGWLILADQPETPALISSDYEEQVALQYLGAIWQNAPGLYATMPGDLNPPFEQETPETAIYISRRAAVAAPEAIHQALYPQAAGEQLIALGDQPLTTLPEGDVVTLDLDFGPKLKLIGWEPVKPSMGTETPPGALPATWQIALYWQTTEPLEEDYTISVRPLANGQLISVAGEDIIQDHKPVWGLYPTPRWRPGEIVRDAYALNLPPDIQPEAMHIIVYKITDAGFANLADQIVKLTALD